MTEYIGLDVSMKETAVSIRRGGERIWRGKCASDPNIIAELVRKRAPAAKRVVFETGPLSVWFYHALRAEGLPAIIQALHVTIADSRACGQARPTKRRRRLFTKATPEPRLNGGFSFGSNCIS